MAKLKKLSATIKFTTDTGFSSSETINKGTPEENAIEVIKEMTRLLTIIGAEEDILQEVEEMIVAVKQDMKNQSK